MSTTKIVDHLGVTDGRVPPAVLAAGAWVAQSLVSRERGGRFARLAGTALGGRGSGSPTVQVWNSYAPMSQ